MNGRWTPQTLEPGATIGILGGGQLGRMLALVARRMGYHVQVVDPDPLSPAAQVADVHYQGSVADPDIRSRFAQAVDVVTYEFEHLPIEGVYELRERRPVYPPPEALQVAQHRILEKQFLAGRGLPTAPFAPVRTDDDLAWAVTNVGTPAVLKSATMGYDGKGQIRVDHPGDAVAAWRSLGVAEAIWEKWIDFRTEFSVIVARDVRGRMAVYPPIRNWHRRHILDVSVLPSGLPDTARRDAKEIARQIASGLELVGVLCVEFFYERSGDVLVNEIAPRPHNSGHLTIEACVTSQFEQQLRAICGLPLGVTRPRSPAAMANLLGELWFPQAPLFSRVCRVPGLYLHLYGKARAAIGRKMGHLTVLAPSAPAALRRVHRARRLLQESHRDATSAEIG